jgi:hypothetical protein
MWAGDLASAGERRAAGYEEAARHKALGAWNISSWDPTRERAEWSGVRMQGRETKVKRFNEYE